MKPKRFYVRAYKHIKRYEFNSGRAFEFYKGAVIGSRKVNNVFFQAVEKLLENTKSADLQMEMLNFVKIYNDASSSQSTLKNIQSILKNISTYMTSNYRQPLQNIMDKLTE